MKNKTVKILDWGLIDYAEAWERQKALQQSIVNQKLANRESAAPQPTDNYLVFCQHPPVYTLGKGGKMKNLLVSEAELKEKGVGFYPIERGGDITFHGPGQLVGYPIFDLENFFTDLHRYLRTLEEAIIQTVARWGVAADVIPGLTGVWVDKNGQQPRKIAAMGIKCSRWVSMHGFALNVNTDLSYFDQIIPCGIDDKAVTSLAKETGQTADFQEVQKQTLFYLQQGFGFELING